MSSFIPNEFIEQHPIDLRTLQKALKIGARVLLVGKAPSVRACFAKWFDVTFRNIYVTLFPENSAEDKVEKLVFQ
jgi:hypothetical protein